MMSSYQPARSLARQADCQPKNSTYYTITHSGLESLLQEYLDHFQTLLQLVGCKHHDTLPIGRLGPIGWPLHIPTDQHYSYQCI